MSELQEGAESGPRLVEGVAGLVCGGGREGGRRGSGLVWGVVWREGGGGVVWSGLGQVYAR